MKMIVVHACDEVTLRKLVVAFAEWYDRRKGSFCVKEQVGNKEQSFLSDA